MSIISRIKARLKRPKTGQEIAASGDDRDITRPWVGALALSDDSVLRSRGSQDLQIYREVLSDDEVKSAFTQRQDALISREISVKAGGERPIDAAAAEAMQAQIESLGFDRITRLMHYGVFYGYAVAEIIYGTRDNLLWIDEVKVRDRRRFRFTPKGELRLLTPGNMFEGEPCPAPYFWSFCTGADHDDEPYGQGLAHWLYWPTFFKRNDIKFWLIFLDKFGMPTVAGKYQEGASDEQKRDLLALTRAIATDSGVIMPEGISLEILSAARSGAADYQAMYSAMNEAIRRIIVGQISSSGGASKGIGGDESLQEAILTSIAKSDADVICESWNRGPGAWFTEFNFPGAAVPQVYRVFEEPEDLTELAERDQKIADTTGYRPTLAQVKDTYGGDWEEKPAVATPPPGEPVAEFADAGTGSDTTTLQAQQLNAALTPVMDGWVQQIQEMVNRAESLDELRSGIDALLPELSLDQYADIMAQAMTAAQLAGRYELMEELHGR
ncbi:DUF935 family protein [Salmonella enterica]|uniref:Portal protein n=1 Tax=Salmonella enterica subsp. enterica serovar Panama TaxID=29472 RepID=A0A5U8J7H1_SALET|nr:DUF935 family protein [Salmonella enterica]EBR7993312.1 portal protein [Salmonella enterica subsp. enterica serovar Panama]ECC9937734.1 DUF935 family protein [Salmonella enterica subsp. enterica]EEN2094725.1 DUF935 family protein [Salmonella enterica subsp. enterica serovar Florida]ASD84982.1 portal protein [Salmonella enterica subsp. enterica serovar India str. SA20085604]EBR8434093.1 portal protein [Salmonella enterica subsp. enterica serovar Panama]